MQELVKVVHNDIFTNSMVIAEGTGNEHRATQQLIRTYETDIQDFGKLTFEMSPLESGQKAKVYFLNELQATFIISLMKNTRVVVDFKKELVKQFYQMRQLLFEHQSPVWKDTRSLTKDIRKKETDSINLLIKYAIANGSQNARRYYSSLSILADMAAGGWMHTFTNT